MQPMFKSERQTNPIRDSLFMQLLNAFGHMNLGRSEQMQIAQDAAGRKLNSLSEMTLPEIQRALIETGVGEGRVDSWQELDTAGA